MDWKLVGVLSLFGLAMAFGTVFFIPSKLEPVIWLVIFLVCAYLIAKERRDKHFLHGLMVGLVNSVWITAAHIFFFDQYIANHAREAEMMKSMPSGVSPKVLMAMSGPVIGLISGVVIGVLAFLAGKMIKPRGAS